MVGAFLKAAVTAATLVSFAPRAGASSYLAEARQLLARGQTRAAEIELKNAVRADPKDLEARYRLARVELALGEAIAAEADAKVAREGGYDPEKTLPLLAETYLAQRKYQQLLRDFPAKTGSAAERASVLVIRGYAQSALDQPDEAQQSFEKAEHLAPRAPQPLLAEARLLASRKQLAAAEEKLDQALTLAPHSPQLLLEKASLLRMKGEAKSALAVLDQLLLNHPGLLSARLERGEMLLFASKLGPARKDIDAVLAVQPGNVVAIYLQAIIFTATKEFKKANTNLERISGAIPALPRGYYVDALVKYNLKQLPQAADAARRYTARFPEDPAAAKLLALIELAEARPASTIATLKKFTESGKADAGMFALLGQAYTEIGRSAEALKAFETAKKLQPKNPLFDLQLGASRLRVGETAKGLGNLERSLKAGPSNAASEVLFMTDLALGRWQAAADTARKLQEAEPKSPAPLHLLALVKLAQFDLAGARADLTALAAKFPDFLPAKFNLARVDALEGKPVEAEKVLRTILQKAPSNTQALGRLVALLLQQRQKESALAALEHAHSVAPANKQIVAQLITLYVRLGDKKKALALAQDQPGGNDPANIPVIAAAAVAQLAAGDKAEAAQSFRRLIVIEPDSIGPRRELASILSAQGDLAGARQAIDAALKIDPKNAQLVADRIGVELKGSGVAAALATAKRIAKSDPSLPTAPALEGDVYMAARQYAKASEAYQKAFRKAPSAILVTRLARALSASGKHDAATVLLRGWLKKHPGDLGVAEILAVSDLSARRYAEAKAGLEKVVAKNPLDAVALNNLAWLYQQAGNPGARALAERAFVIAPNLPQTADTLGWILVQTHSAANALGLLQEASAADPTDPEIRYHFAVALNDTGHHRQARRILLSLTKKPVKFDDKKAAEKLLDTLSKS